MRKKNFKNSWEADRGLSPVRSGEVYSYSRLSCIDPRSTASDDGLMTSITDQNKVNGETALKFGLPPVSHYLVDEGFSGSLWYEGVSLGVGDDDAETAFRPAFTQLRDATLRGHCRALVVYSQCRLGRGVGIIEAFLLKLCHAHGVRVCEPSGMCDLWSADSRSYIRFIAGANARHREKSAADSARGIEERFSNGELVVGSGLLGFRSLAPRSRRAVPQPEELEWVRWIYEAFVRGIDARGPLTSAGIAAELTARGFVWPADLGEGRGRGVSRDLGFLTRRRVRVILSDVRYQAKQRRYGVLGECTAFLVDGAPVVDPETFELAQRRLKALGRNPPARNRTKHPFGGLVRCGVDGETLLGRESCRRSDGSQATVWGRYSPGSGHACQHIIPRVAVDVLAEYYRTHLSQILLMELESRGTAESLAGALERKETLQGERAAVERWLELDFPAYAEKLSPQTAGRMEDGKLLRLAEIKEEVRALDETLSGDAATVEQLRNVADLSDALVIDLIAHTVRWAAMIPIGEPLEGDRRRIPKRFTGIGGKVLFLLAGGVYHTAVVELHRLHRSAVGHTLRPAREDEVIGTLRDLPKPSGLIAGARRICRAARTPFDPDDLAPGALPEHLEEAKDLFPDA